VVDLHAARSRRHFEQKAEQIMKPTLVAAILSAAALLATSPLLASAQTEQAGPIHLDNVQIEQSYGVFDDFQPGVVSVSFTNESSSTATKVVFDLVNFEGATIARYNDVGSFPQGSAIRHRFENTHDDPGQQIKVTAVTFADGTTWNDSTPVALPDTAFPAE
jgi:hypothetical protein